MSFFNKVINIFKGPAHDEFKKSLPSIIQANVNPRDSWEIIGELGDGAFGKVEKAVSKTNRNKFAAAKAIEVQDGETIDDFLVEIEILTGCKHPNIVDLYAAYFYDNKLHMMLELCGGGAVDGIMIELEKPLTEPQIAYIANYTNEALIFLHEKNVIHRDLKAGNILLTQDGIVKLVVLPVDNKVNHVVLPVTYYPVGVAPDFGVSAKLKDRYEKRDTFIGTPYWMAPEVMMCETFKDQPYSTISDVWSFGITLIEMAQMEPPNSNVSPMRVLIKVLKSDPPTLDHPNSWSVYFKDFLANCLVKNPADRMTAQQLQSHPFFRAATDKKPVLALLAEVNAEIQEEVVIDDDRGSVDESLPGSEDQGSDDTGTWAVLSSKPVPSIPEAFVKPEVIHRVAEDVVLPDTPKKRVAPPPPSEVVMKPAEKQRTPSPLRVTTEAAVVLPPAKLKHVLSPANGASPRKEAMDVLDDLNGILEDEDKVNYFDDLSPSSSNGPPAGEPWKVSPRSISVNNSRTSSPVPENNIRRVINSARGSSCSPRTSRISLAIDPPMTPTENVSRSDSFRKNEVHIRISDVFSQDNVSKARLDVTAQRQLSRAGSKLSVGSPRRPSQSSGCDDPAEHVSMITDEDRVAKATTHGEFGGKHSAKRDAETVVSQANVARIAASFDTPQKLDSPMKSNKITMHSPPQVRVKQAMMPNQNTAGFAESKSVSKNEPEKADYFAENEGSKKTAPPPEPPVDYEKKQELKENDPPSTAAERPESPAAAEPVKPRKLPGEPRLGVRKNPHRQTVTKKTRTYMIDGMQVTSTTLHVLGAKEDMQFRKQQLQDLRRLQREEARQKQELQAEGVALADQQERKFQNEKMNLVRQYEADIENLERRQKREIEEAEKGQEEELRMAQKKLKVEQEKDLRAFKERKKQEMKIVKQELDMLPRAQRKEAMKIKMEHLEHENHMMEAEFLMQLQKNADATLVRLAQKHKERIAQLERQFLMQKHLLLRAKENSDWELEEKQMGEKYVLHRKLFKDEYFLLRTQMLGRHQKEVGQALKIHQEEEDELSRALALDRKKLPKMLRQEAKTRNIMFKESLRISMQPMTQSEMSERLRKFEDQENARCKHALDEHDAKSARKVTLLKERHSAAMRELEEMQNEKKKQLLEKERLTMQEHEKKYFEMREQWQSDLAPRKLMLESKFQEELEAQERFYGISLHMPLASTSVIPPRFS